MGGSVALALAAAGGRVAWVVPTYKNGRPLWRWAEAAVSPLLRARRVTINRAERIIAFPGGGFLGLYSMDNEHSIRGEHFHLVVLDEAARIPESAWTDAIQPTLADVGGEAILISTPVGRNWFWRAWLAGQGDDPTIRSWQAPSTANPNPRIQAAAAQARARVAERTYRQEWLAEFVEDGGVFRNVEAVATALPMEHPPEDHTISVGIDWGRTGDWTSMTVWDATAQCELWHDRFHGIPYPLQEQRVVALVQRYHAAVVVAEANAMGQPIIEHLQEQGLPIVPFPTSNATKALLVDAFALALEQRRVTLLRDPVQIGELLAYAATTTPSGLVRYGAPEGMHDDCVMSLLLAYHGATAATPAVAPNPFYQ
jgi:phage terminase large subunit-like protein